MLFSKIVNLLHKIFQVLDFKKLGDLIKIVSLIQLNINDWKNSTCTCKHFSKKYFCPHVVVVEVGLRLVTVPEICEDW